MKNFILNFGKHKGQYFFDVPVNYQEWLLNQNFKANQHDFDGLKNGDLIEINKKNFSGHHGHIVTYDSYQFTFVNQNKKSITVSYIDDTQYTGIDSKIFVTNKIKKLQILKSTIISVTVLN
jgi:uncharacterized protein (DUF3820 family)